jgi:hypothetical protein
LSDRAPGASIAVFVRTRSVAFRIVERLGLDVVPIGLPFQPDLLVHVVLWGAVGFIAHRLIGTRASAVTVAAIVTATSVVFEFGQVAFTATRGMATLDMAANLVGVSIGVLAAIAFSAAAARLARGHVQPTR